MDGDYLRINDLNDVDFQSILNDYIEFFTKKYLVIETNYKKVSEIEVRFAKHDIHHLLGLHKVQDSHINATKTLSKILDGSMTLGKVRNHPRFDEIKNRLLSYNFLHYCFIDQSIKLCVIVNSEPNPQKLSIVFIDDYKNRNLLLGLKKVRGREFYVPATMYVSNDSSVYYRKPRSNIRSIIWHDY
ncbi:PBECR4 domain-containing protein [Salinicoccus roseus]|uniref:PBECR4 domain-containing protein n=1 Tax=Salinicoccus roseus TaxID=45670 RepID=UPI001EF6C496|nr:PBECR4 domain-containing protein [Salinicoccus roseus]MCG7331193.1 PBECR4 domain-containing protein [Salinicoccus roseus]